MFSRSGRYCRFKSDAFSRAGWSPIFGDHVFLRLSWHRRAEYAVFFDYSGGRVRPLPRGFHRVSRKASACGYSERRVKTRWIRALGAPKRVKNAYDRGTPHGTVGKDFSPRGFWALHPGPRAAKLRVWGPFWRNLAGCAPGNAP